jgi:hypothetical protein
MINKKLLILIVALFGFQIANAQYDTKLVKNYPNQEGFKCLVMNRTGNRVKAKYFAASLGGKSVYQRYKDWAAGRNIVLVGSGTYTDDYFKPTGLTIDNGYSVNNTLLDKFDGLVIVYATGGIAVSNLENADLTLSGSGVDPNRKYDLNNSWDLNTFKNWASSEQATVFQTHLLIYKNKLEISSYNSSQATAKRRFLAAGKNGKGETVHVIVDYPTNCTLYQGASKVRDFLIDEVILTEITYMINLDTGAKNAFQFYKSDGTESNIIQGDVPLKDAVNLVVYYYE